MCGRYSLKLSNSRKGKQLCERSAKLGLKYKEGEIFPGDQVLCVIPKESLIDLSVMKWGIQNRFFQINARYESLQDAISYGDMKNRRCAVVCNGFYEWDADKRKYYISTQEEFVYLACIFNKEQQLLVLTKAADETFSKIHDREPIVMNQNEMLRFIHNQDCVFEKKKYSFELQDKEMPLF